MQRSIEGKSNLASTILMFSIASTLLMVAMIYPELAVRGQYGPPPSAPTNTNVPSAPAAPPVIIPPPPAPVPYPTGITLPTDVTPVNTPGAFALDSLSGISQNDAALQGIHQLSDSSFPKFSDLKGPTDWILVNAQAGCLYDRLSPYAIELKDGTALFSVKHPSNMGMVRTALGDISVRADADVLISFTGGVLRVFNLDGRGEIVMAQLNKGPFGTPETDPTVSVAPGFELVASTNKLTRSNIKPADGIARRNFKVFSDGHLAVSEFSVESVLQTSELIASMSQRDTGLKAKRVLGDMSKMAAVLNHMNGTAGYTAQAKAQ